MFSDYTTSLPILEIACLLKCVPLVAAHILHVFGWLKALSERLEPTKHMFQNFDMTYGSLAYGGASPNEQSS